MTPIGKRRLLKLADILDTADAEHRKNKEPTYDQAPVMHGCGTPACAMGHWAANNRRRFLYDKIGGFIRLRDFPDMSNVAEIAEVEFGIDFDQGSELFDSYGCGESRTAKQAARYIRKFVTRVEREQKEAA